MQGGVEGDCKWMIPQGLTSLERRTLCGIKYLLVWWRNQSGEEMPLTRGISIRRGLKEEKVSNGITYPPMRISKWPRIHASQALSLGVLLFTRPRMVVEEYNYTYLSQCLPHSPFINIDKPHDVGTSMMRGYRCPRQGRISLILPVGPSCSRLVSRIHIVLPGGTSQ